MSYKQPAPEYDFRKNSDYQKIVRNSGIEDTELYFLIKESHYFIDYVATHTLIDVPLRGTTQTLNCLFESQKFSSIEECCDFIKEMAKSNYFYIYSFSNLELCYGTVSFKYQVPNLDIDCKMRIREWKLNQVLECK